MKTVDVYILAEYQYRFSLGIWTYYIGYKKSVIKRSGSISAESYMQTLYFALSQAIQALNQPCIIKIHSKKSLGFKNPNKSHYKHMLFDILHSVYNAGHIIEVINNTDFSQVDMWEQLYGKPRKEDSTGIGVKKPDYEKASNPNDVFEHNNESREKLPNDWKSIYDDLMDDRKEKWNPISGGY